MPNKTTSKTTKSTQSSIKKTSSKVGTSKTTSKPKLSRKERYAGASREYSVKEIILITFVIASVVCLVVGLIFGLRMRESLERALSQAEVTVNANKNATKVGYSSKTVGTVERYRPVAEIRDGGLGDIYPTYGYTKNLTAEQKRDVINESTSLTANGTWRDVSHRTTGSYDKMDNDGYLYYNNGSPVLDGAGNHRQLYKHTSAVGMYLGNVDDNEPGVIKTLTFKPRSYTSYYDVTGLYAPAGEVIKVQMSEEDMEKTGGIVIHIGQALYNGQANNIWEAKGINRMPVILNTMQVTKTTATLENGVYTAYVGSFLGGPIYVRDETKEFSVTISGGVNYSHFILGVTTEEEFNENAKSSVPFFDLEVWDSGVLHSGPKRYAQAFNYQQISQAASLWEKISLVSTRVKNQGVVFLYDTFVAAGAAVAFPGRRSVNCPMGWMSNSLNYHSLVTSGAWGNMHEYHHNFQGFGCGDDGEVTNNSLNLISYSLFTKISSARQIGSYGGAGLGGWNSYTSATWALERVKQGAITSTNGLAVYATLMHNLGQDAFIKSARGRGESYFVNWGNNTHQNMSYYVSLVSRFAGTSYIDSLNEKQKDYPMFVPVSSVYQTGRSYKYNGIKKYIETQQPYVIPYGEEFTVDLSKYTVNDSNQYLSGSVVIPDGFSYKIKNVRTPDTNGTFEKQNDYVYTFKPGKQIKSGKIYVTLQITKDDGAFKVDDVDLVLEFEQSHEMKKNILERTTYTYAPGTAYTSATEAYEANYEGYVQINDGDNINPMQNSNTDVWYTFDEPAPDNSVVEIRGKLYIGETGKYRIAFRGRWNCALYVSVDDGKTYELAAYIPQGYANASNFHTELDNTYKDYQLEGQSWVYFKAVMICGYQQISAGKLSSFIGLGISQWTVPTYTMTTTTDENGVATNHYFNTAGQEVTAEEANNAEPIVPRSISYATAYRNSYEFQKEFESDYFYTRDYNYSYEGEPIEVTKDKTQTLVEELSKNCRPWNNDEVNEGIQNLFDDDINTEFHTHNSYYVSEGNPVIMTIDIGEDITANSLIIYKGKGFPKTFQIEGSLDGETFFDIGRWTNSGTNPQVSAEFPFPEATFRYYRMTIKASHSNSNRVSFTGLKFVSKLVLTGNGHNLISPDNDALTYKGNWRVETADSNFGHVYVGKKQAVMQFKFYGTRVAVLSSKEFKQKFEVYIDGKKYNSIEISPMDKNCPVSYISLPVEKGYHDVIIRCLGEASFDAIALY